jgi:DNA mismatch repair protein MutS2
MTQAGLHIPANEGSQMNIFEDVYADIGDEQSIEQSLSTFSSHMKNIVRILADAGDNSLVLFDELGAGTDPTEGAALAMAVIEFLRGTGTLTVATTHYSELKVYALSTKGVENACCEFDVETLRPTYRLLIGIPGRSNAFAISQRLGLSEGIIRIARDFLSKEDIKFEDILQTIEKNKSQSENERMQAEAYKLEIETLKNELSSQKARLNIQKEKILKDAKEEARRILRNARSESEDILTQLRRLETEAKESERNRLSEELRLKLKNKIDSIDDSLTESIMPRNTFIKPPENLKPGDSIIIASLGREGTVLIPPDNDGQAVVQAGIMKINVHVSNLRLAQSEKNEPEKTGMGKIGVSKAKTITTEIDLRGFNIDEASESLDKYLDDAVISGLHEVTVIHGKGTGTLRNGIHQYLKSNSHVKSFRLGKIGEGDSGVSVVELK